MLWGIVQPKCYILGKNSKAYHLGEIGEFLKPYSTYLAMNIFHHDILSLSC